METPAEQASADAVHKVKNAQQAVEVARQLQTENAANAAADRVTGNIGDILQERIEHVLARGTEQEKSIILARVPYICQDIKSINSGLKEITTLIKESNAENDKKYVNQDQFNPFKWTLITIATVVITTLVGAILAQVLVK